MSSACYPQLPHISSKGANFLEVPSLRIRTEEDVKNWKVTRGYQNYLLFLHRLSESVVGHDLSDGTEHRSLSSAVRSMLDLLNKLDTWIDGIPPLPTPQRFGNLAFRTWGKKLEDNADDLLKSLLPSHLHGFIYLVAPYFVISFGSFTRMDYGTGHEAAFSLLLLCLTLVRFFEPSPTEERHLVLMVFYRYLRLCWRLQDVYRLEPAGSHGVWGLDDYSFLGYIFGSAQLRVQSEFSVSAVLRPPLPPTNLYFLSISRIHAVKQGPFFEHSSQLYAIATGVPNWAKVHSGLFKMYEAEVLGKRVVVQHIPAGGLLEWNTMQHSNPPVPTELDGRSIQNAMTGAPWAPSTLSVNSASVLPPSDTSAPWATQSRAHPTTILPAPVSTGAPWAASTPKVNQNDLASAIARASATSQTVLPSDSK